MTNPKFGRMRVVTEKDEAEAAAKKTGHATSLADRIIMEAAVHIPVGVAIGISVYGYQQYGPFLWALAPLTFALSMLLSRTYAMVQNACSLRRWDVALFLVLIGAGSFAAEGYAVHLGLVRFNTVNEATGLQTFAEEVMIAASVILGLMNVFSRRAYVTGHQLLTAKEQDRLDSESWSRWAAKRENWMETTVKSGERRERYGHEDAKGIRGRGNKITVDDYITAAEAAEAEGKLDQARILRGMAGEKINPKKKAG